MSKINIEFDTVSKDMVIMKDGQAMSEVCYVHIGKSYNEDGKFAISIETEKEDKEQKVYVRTVVYATETAQSEFAAAVAARYAEQWCIGKQGET